MILIGETFVCCKSTNNGIQMSVDIYKYKKDEVNKTQFCLFIYIIYFTFLFLFLFLLIEQKTKHSQNRKIKNFGIYDLI